MNQETPHSYIHYFKCQSCQLEFAVYSWKEKWNEHFVPFCPECGKQEVAFLHKVSSDKPIFKLVYRKE